MAAARLLQVQNLNLAKPMVQMDKVDIIRFGEAGKYCLATDRLNSCHAVAVVSKKAAILAHIAPHAPEHIRHKFSSADDYIKTMMTTVINCFKENKKYFDNQGSGGIVVYAMHDGKIALPDQVKIVAAAIKMIMGLNATPVPYKVLGSKEPRGPNKGVVLIEGQKSGQLPVVWVEDKTVPTPGAGSSSAGSTSAAASSK